MSATREETQSGASESERPEPFKRIAVGVDGFAEGRDATVLGAALARCTGAELMLVAVATEPGIVLPSGMDSASLRQQAAAGLRSMSHELALEARIVTETDLSVARALHRVVRREHRDLLVMGSSRHGQDGRVRIGKRTRQLLGQFDCALAVAPRGLQATPPELRRIGCGYDGTPESRAALRRAAALAGGAGAELCIRCVVDDRIAPFGWSALSLGGVSRANWDDLIQNEMQRLDAELSAQAGQLPATARVEHQLKRGRPADELLELSQHVDLLVIGSRRWGGASRVLAGSTGETLLHDAGCPVLTVPRPAE